MVLRTALPDAFGAEEAVASCRLGTGASVEEAVTGASSPVSRTPRAGEATRKEYSETDIPASSRQLATVSSAPNASGSAVRKTIGTDERSPACLSLILPHHQPTFPLLALIVSGGHSQFVLFQNHGDYQLIGQTQDDAVGEAFDKVAKIIGLPRGGRRHRRTRRHGPRRRDRLLTRSEERRVGKECRSRWSPYH